MFSHSVVRARNLNYSKMVPIKVGIVIVPQEFSHFLHRVGASVNLAPPGHMSVSSLLFPGLSTTSRC